MIPFARALLMALAGTFLVALAGCREEPETPLTTGSTYRVDWPATAGGEEYTRFCLACHGALGRGNGYNAHYLSVAPRDLSAFVRQATSTDDVLVDVIVRGGAARGLSADMPAFGRSLEADEVGFLAVYLRQLPAAPAAAMSPAAVSNESTSSGE